MKKVRDHWEDGDILIPMLDKLLKSKDNKIKLLALQMIFERGWGKAPQMPPESTGISAVSIDWGKATPQDIEYLRGLVGRLRSQSVDGNPTTTGGNGAAH